MVSRIIIFCALLPMLAACALQPKDTGKSYMFALEPARVARLPASDVPLTVALPIAAPELDSYRIALIKNERTWDYYVGARWVEFLPVIVQDALIKALERSGKFRAVASDGAGIPSGLILKTEIRDFQVEYGTEHAAPLIKLRIAVSLHNQTDRKILSSFIVVAEKRAKSDSLAALQSAFQEAFNQVQERLVLRLR